MNIRKGIVLGVTTVASLCLVTVSIFATTMDVAENSTGSCSTKNISTSNENSKDTEIVARKNDAPTEVGEVKVVAELEDGSTLYCELADRHTVVVED